MHTEIEAKFLDVDHDAMRRKLHELGAALVLPKRSMHRINYDLPSSDKRAWVRIRDENDKVTLTYKQLNDRSLHGTKEVNLTVDSFDQAGAFLDAVGLKAKTDQQTTRESWNLDGVEIELDEWPWVKPFLEIEGPNEAAVRKAAAQLGLEWDRAVHGSVEVAYRAEYDVTDEEINTIPKIHFGPVPDWLEAKRRNKK
jgi:adenylate cyclase class 2